MDAANRPLNVLSRELYPVVGPDGYVRLPGQGIWNVWDLRSQLGIVSADLQQGHPANTPGLNIILSAFFSSSGMYDHQAVTLRQRHLSLEMMDQLGIGHLRDRPFGEMSTGEQRGPSSVES